MQVTETPAQTLFSQEDQLRILFESTYGRGFVTLSYSVLNDEQRGELSRWMNADHVMPDLPEWLHGNQPVHTMWHGSALVGAVLIEQLQNEIRLHSGWLHSDYRNSYNTQAVIHAIGESLLIESLEGLNYFTVSYIDGGDDIGEYLADLVQTRLEDAGFNTPLNSVGLHPLHGIAA